MGKFQAGLVGARSSTVHACGIIPTMLPAPWVLEQSHQGDIWSRDWWYQSVLPWIEPLATVFAFMVGTTAAIYAMRAFRLERERDDRWINEQRAAQASLVSSWAGYGDEHDDRHMGAYVLNASAAPVYEVRIHYFVNDEKIGGQMFYSLPPSKEPFFQPMGPVTRLQFEQLETRSVAEGRGSPGNVHVEAQVSFVDATGTRWTRGRTGVLAREDLPGDQH